MTVTPVRKTTSHSPGRKLPLAELAVDFRAKAKGLAFPSEGDYRFVFASTPDGGKGLKPVNVMRAFVNLLKRDIFNQPATARNLTLWSKGPAAAAAFMRRSSTTFDPSDAQSVADAKARKAVYRTLSQNLTDLHLYKVGQRDPGTGKLSQGGLFAYLLLGKTVDHRIAGTYFGAVET